VLQFKNRTPFVGAITLFPDADGIDTLFAIVKGTFRLGATIDVAEDQVPVTMEPKYHGEPATSSLKAASDLSLIKPSTDVLVVGDAHAPVGRVTRSMDVGVRVGPVHKVVRVTGNRFWTSDGLTYGATTPEPFETMPLVWERAFGGRDKTESGVREEPRNPAGTGYRASNGQEAIEGVPLPNLEDPRDLVGSWKQRPVPVCFAPIAPHWEPRRSFAGTYDEQWEATRAPYLPADFDPRFLQIAPPDLVTPQPLVGGEPVELMGFRPDMPTRFELPSVRPRIVFHVSGKPDERPAMLDTVIIEPSALRLQLVWRAALSCDKTALKVGDVEATLAGA
jgi:hypothetical protein